MAMTQEQLARLMENMSIRQKAKLTGQPMGKLSRNEETILRTVEAGAERKAWVNHQEIEKSIVIPQSIPQTREESGLVDPNMVLDDSQVNALRVLHESECACLIGAAGTGKTTLVKRAIANHIYGGDGFEAHGIREYASGTYSIAICAFTGIATQVIKNTLPKWMHNSVMTIHTLLEYKPEGGGDEEGSSRKMFVPTRDASNPLNQNVIFVDEASMVGLELWHRLLDACKPGTKIVLIGDLNQLVPVADTPFFPVVLNAAKNGEDGWGLAELTTIHRQVGPGANRIIDTAHSILNGKRPVFDFELNAKGQVVDENGKPVENAQANPDWRVVNIHVNANHDKAHSEIIAWIDRFRKMEIKSEGVMVYNPYEDLTLTAGNGWQLEQKGSLVQQAQLNATLSEIIVPETDENPTYIIDAGRETRKYTVGDRVMCTKNESPGIKDRVTNGMLGVITEIVANGNWDGDRKRFGTKHDVDSYMKASLINSSGDLESMNSLTEFVASYNRNADSKERENEERQASHIVTVKYNTGAIRKYSSAAGVASTQLGYAITTHKAQGSQADTVMIVCHGTVKFQLNREWFYTAVTRAKKRVIIFSTPQGMRTAIARQQIFGESLGAKIERYMQQVDTSGKFIRLGPNW